MGDREECRLCRAQVPAGVTECPECGYNPRRTLLIVGGAIFLLGLVLSPFAGSLGIAIVIVGALLIGSGLFYASPTK